MHQPTDRIAHTTAFITPVVEHWLERAIVQWVHPMKDRSDDPSHQEQTLLPRSYISLRAPRMIDLSKYMHVRERERERDGPFRFPHQPSIHTLQCLVVLPLHHPLRLHRTELLFKMLCEQPGVRVVVGGGGGYLIVNTTYSSHL